VRRDREKVLERFYRLPDSVGDGCGLGLAIVRQIAQQHGAEVIIGTSFALGGASVEIHFPPVGA
jgi:signal transduction histidine kinase